jgi:hypothetical protein
MGTISGDGDYFMSVLDWSSIQNMRSNLFITGIDDYGLSMGYAHKANKVYLGVSYSGSLVDELFRRMTNQEVLSLRKEDTITPGKSYVSSLLDQEGKTPPGITESKNDVNLILGAGVFGLRLGFAEYIRAVDLDSEASALDWTKEQSFDTSLKPSLEFGFNFKVGSVRVKPSLRAAFDIHEYSSLDGWLDTDWVVNEKMINYNEPSAGITLGFDFAKSDHASAELILDADAAYRLYRKQGDTDPVRSIWYYDATPTPSFPLVPPSDEQYDVTIPMDLRITGSPRFVYTGELSPKFTLGVKVEAGIGYDILSISQEDSSSADLVDKITRLTITPDLAIGASFHLIPGHFSLHTGIGLNLFSYQETKTEYSGSLAGTLTLEPEQTVKVIELPSARFAAGLSLNLTEALAVDLMAVTSGLSMDATKFTLLLTVKK